MKKVTTELVFILDKSGSMSGLEGDTIGGYNSMLAKQRILEGECRITTVLFNSCHEVLHDRIDIKEIKDISQKEYKVGGMTALLDAVGETIQKVSNMQKYIDEEHRSEKVMFVIITDGEENSSHNYTAEMVKKEIKQKKTEYGWEFVFLGANIDSLKTAEGFGIASDRAIDYIADREGTKLNYKVMGRTVTTFRESGTITEDCFDEIRNDVKRRGGRK